MEDREIRELAKVLRRATKVIMARTGVSFDQAKLRAKEGLKQHIALRVDAMKDLVAEGHSVEDAFSEAKRLVRIATIIDY